MGSVFVPMIWVIGMGMSAPSPMSVSEMALMDMLMALSCTLSATAVKLMTCALLKKPMAKNMMLSVVSCSGCSSSGRLYSSVTAMVLMSVIFFLVLNRLESALMMGDPTMSPIMSMVQVVPGFCMWCRCFRKGTPMCAPRSMMGRLMMAACSA